MKERKLKHQVVCKLLRYTVLLLAILVCTNITMASEYPSRSIKAIVPYAAGGGTDVMARAVAQYIDIGQPMVIINIEGGASVVGTMEVYHSQPDGYTLLYNQMESMLIYALTGVMPVPAWKEFEPVANVVRDASIISVRKGSMFNNFKDVIEYAKKHPGKLKWGTVGSGGANHTVSLQIFEAAGMDVNFVPYDGAAKSRPALLGGHIDVLLSQISEIQSSIETGEAIPLAVTTKDRSKFYPEVPACSEFGIDVDMALHRALWAPPGTPASIVSKIGEKVKGVTCIREFVSLMEDKLKYEVFFLDSLGMKLLYDQIAPKYEDIAKRHFVKSQ